MIARAGALRGTGATAVAPAGASLALGRAALWVLIAAKVVTSWGVQWDIQWHVAIGRDSFWIAPHLMTYAGVTAMVLVSFGMIAWTTLHPGANRGAATVRVLGLAATRGFHLAAWGIALTVLAAPIDDLWHRLFGLDVTLWSPPHLLGLFGAAINTLGCFLIAPEVYPAPSRARFAALVLTGTLLFIGIHFALQPTFRFAYVYGGFAVHGYAMLASLLVPLAFVTTARLTGNRWAPAFVLIVMVAFGLAGLEIARAGFEILQPVSVIAEEIVKDPTSPIAVVTAIARANGTTPGVTAGLAQLIGLVPVAAMVLVDPRRRPIAATVAYALVLFVVMSVRLASLPAFEPRMPGAGDTLAALAVTLIAGLAGGFVADRLAGSLDPAAAPPA